MFKSIIYFWGKSHRSIHRLVVVFLISLLTITSLPILSQGNEVVKEAQIQLNQAKDSYRSGNYDKAITAAEDAVAKLEENHKPLNAGLARINLGRMWSEIGNQVQACETLTKGVLEVELNSTQLNSNSDFIQAFFRLCDNQNLSDKKLEKEIDLKEEIEKIGNYDSRLGIPTVLRTAVQAKGLQVLGDVLRVIGKLNESELILDRGLDLIRALTEGDLVAIASNTNLDMPKTKGLLLLGLANTYRAQGDLERDRRSSTRYGYIPWQYVERKIKTKDYKVIDAYYEKSEYEYKEILKLNVLKGKELELVSRLNLLSLYIEKQKIEDANSLLPIDIDNFNLKDKRVKIFAKIGLAKNIILLMQLKEKMGYQYQINDENGKSIVAVKSSDLINVSKKYLTQAIAESKQIQDDYAASFATGSLGRLYEYLGKIDEAYRETQKALYLSQANKLPSLAYQWNWQLGRLLEDQGYIERAIKYYENAVAILESTRIDIITINSDIQFSFRDNVEPLYRSLTSLLLTRDGVHPSEDDLKKAVYFTESLHLAELENFLHCNPQSYTEIIQADKILDLNQRINVLNNQISQVLDKSKRKTAFIYPINIEGRIFTIVELPGDKDQKILYHITSLEDVIGSSTYNIESLKTAQNEIDLILNRAKKLVTKKTRISRSQYDALRKLYNWILADFEDEFGQADIESLIFVMDREIRQIPVPALFDGDEFVIEKKFTTSIIPAVQFLRSQNFKLKKRKALLVGSIYKRNTYTNIADAVEKQLDVIKIHFDSPKILDNGTFTANKLKRELSNSLFNIVHIVTHGQFSSDPDQSFLLTDDYPELKEVRKKRFYSIKINQLGLWLTQGKRSFVQSDEQGKVNPLELLFLSACSTSQGDNRAVLGMAGIAIRSGAQATIAPLWQVDPRSSQKLIERFYHYFIDESQNKSIALQRAQIDVMKDSRFDRPYHWAPFILVGN